MVDKLQTSQEILNEIRKFEPNFAYNDKWCRYCGAKAASAFSRSPWGHRMLCVPR